MSSVREISRAVLARDALISLHNVCPLGHSRSPPATVLWDTANGGRGKLILLVYREKSHQAQYHITPLIQM